MEHKPTVSVVMPSYNHEKFVGQAIQSVLNQTYKDFELIVTDDGSPDNSKEVINSFSDERMRTFFFEKNQGAAQATWNGVKEAKGKYIALLNSDDMWTEDKLEKQLEFLEAHDDYGAVFSDVEFIREDGTAIIEDFVGKDIFRQDNRSQGEWLERFFFLGNCLCHPSVLIKKELYANRKLYSETLRQLPDFKLWIEIVKKTKIHVMPEKLVKFRILDNNKNTSAGTPLNRVRIINELYLMGESFFEDIPNNVFIDGFKKYFRVQTDFYTDNMLKCEKAFLFLEPHGEVSLIYNMLGMSKLYNLMHQADTYAVLRDKYYFTEKEFHIITGKVDPIRILEEPKVCIQKVEYIPTSKMKALKILIPQEIKNFIKLFLPMSLCDKIKNM